MRKAGGSGWQSGSMDQPSDLSATNGLDVYVADYGNHRILHFDRDLNLQSASPSAEETDATEISFRYPRSVASSRFGDLLVVDGENNRVVRLTGSRGEGKPFGDLHGGKGALIAPSRIRITGNDRVFVLDSGRIVQYDIFGNYVRTFGRDRFPGLRTFAVDAENLYVLDSCRVHVLGGEGATRAEFLMPKGEGDASCESIVDFQIFKETIICLSRRTLWSVPLPEEAR